MTRLGTIQEIDGKLYFFERRKGHKYITVWSIEVTRGRSRWVLKHHCIGRTMAQAEERIKEKRKA